MLSGATPDRPVDYLTLLLLTAVDAGSLPKGIELEQLVNQYRQSRYVIDVLMIGMAIKDYETVQEQARNLLKADLPESFDVAFELKFTRTRLEHLAMENPPEGWLLKRAVNNRDVGDANFQTALWHWSHGDVETSREYLQGTIDSDSYWDEDYHWARAMLKSVTSK